MAGARLQPPRARTPPGGPPRHRARVARRPHRCPVSARTPRLPCATSRSARTSSHATSTSSVSSGARATRSREPPPRPLMDLGATICLARIPRCECCPLAGDCPSRGTRDEPARRQSRFEGSFRQRRAAVLRHVADGAAEGRRARPGGRRFARSATAWLSSTATGSVSPRDARQRPSAYPGRASGSAAGRRPGSPPSTPRTRRRHATPAGSPGRRRPCRGGRRCNRPSPGRG